MINRNAHPHLISCYNYGVSDQVNLNRLKQEAQEAENDKRYFEASILYKNLLGEASRQNDPKLIAEAKKKMLEMNELAKDEFKEISVEHEVSNEEIEQAIKGILGDSNRLEDTLCRIGHHPHLYPKKKAIEESFKKNIPIFSILASNHVVSDDNHALGGNDQYYIWYTNNYGIHQDVIMQLCMGRIFHRLETEYNMDFESLKLYLHTRKLFLEEDFVFIEEGLKHFFNGDYPAAIHILVPRFEKCLVELSRALGIDVISLKRQKKGTRDVITSDATLSAELLRKSEYTSVWGEDFCEQLVYVFYERLGYGLRHKVAHGTITVSECGRPFCELIIYMYLVLAARVKFKIKK
jgi:hypothetical protein